MTPARRHNTYAPETAIMLASLVLAALSIVPLSFAEAQHLTRLPAAPSCPACSIGAQRTAVISDEAANGEPVDGLPFSMARASDGRVYMISARFRPLVFDPRTRRVTLIGRSGGGPGEFKTPTRMFVLRDGRLALLDPAQLRLTLFSSDGVPVATTRVPSKMAPQAALLDDGVLVYNASFNTSDAIGFPFHVIGADGRIIRSFGPEVEIRTPEDAARLRHSISASTGHRFWAASELRYEVGEWDVDGRLIRSFTRHPAWFRGADRFRPSTPNRAFTPFVTAIRQVGASRLWILVAVPSAQFASGLGEAEVGKDGVSRYQVVSNSRHYDTMVEVIDLDAGRVLSSQRLSGYFPFFLDDEHIASYNESDDGVPRIEIWRLSITGQ